MDRDKYLKMKPFGQVETTLELLRAVETGDSLSQRGFAARLGVALGLTNALLKCAVKKGLIKVKDAPAKRYKYYLTPKGFAEKSQLSAEYLSSSLRFFSHARDQYEDALLYCERRGWKRIVIVGSGELAQIATLAAQSCEIPLKGVVGDARNMGLFLGLPVYADVSEVGDVDAYIVADSLTAQQTYTELSKVISEERIFTPLILHVSRIDKAALADENEGGGDA